MDKKILLDNDGRRSGTDRRKFSYAAHIPERRSGIDRRKGFDRRGHQREYANHMIKKGEEQKQSA